MALTVEQIDTAIDKILTTGQSASVDGVNYTAASLSTLWAMRKRAVADQSRSSGKRPVFRSFNMSGAAS